MARVHIGATLFGAEYGVHLRPEGNGHLRTGDGGLVERARAQQVDARWLHGVSPYRCFFESTGYVLITMVNREVIAPKGVSETEVCGNPLERDEFGLDPEASVILGDFPSERPCPGPGLANRLTNLFRVGGLDTESGKSRLFKAWPIRVFTRLSEWPCRISNKMKALQGLQTGIAFLFRPPIMTTGNLLYTFSGISD